MSYNSNSGRNYFLQPKIMLGGVLTTVALTIGVIGYTSLTGQIWDTTRSIINDINSQLLERRSRRDAAFDAREEQLRTMTSRVVNELSVSLDDATQRISKKLERNVDKTTHR